MAIPYISDLEVATTVANDKDLQHLITTLEELQIKPERAIAIAYILGARTYARLHRDTSTRLLDGITNYRATPMYGTQHEKTRDFPSADKYNIGGIKAADLPKEWRSSEESNEQSE